MAQAAKKDDDTALRDRIRAELRAENMSDDEKKVRGMIREESRGVFLEALAEFFGSDDDAGEGGDADKVTKINPPKGGGKGKGVFDMLLGERE